MNRTKTPIPEPVAQLRRQLDEFGSTHPRRTRLPEALWQAAVGLARQHGIYSVSHPLRLDYVGLKKRLEGTPGVRRQKRIKTAFVELIPTPPSPPEGYILEFESSTGSKMRVQWKTAGSPDWMSLLRAWRETAG